MLCCGGLPSPPWPCDQRQCWWCISLPLGLRGCCWWLPTVREVPHGLPSFSAFAQEECAGPRSKSTGRGRREYQWDGTGGHQQCPCQTYLWIWACLQHLTIPGASHTRVSYLALRVMSQGRSCCFSFIVILLQGIHTGWLEELQDQGFDPNVAVGDILQLGQLSVLFPSLVLLFLLFPGPHFLL